MDAAARERVGLLCDQLSRWPSLETTIRDGGAQSELTTLLALLSGDTDPDGQRITELLDASESSCAREGLVGLTSRNGDSLGGMAGLPPGMNGAPEVVGWTCPFDRCSRVVMPDETSQPPTCAALQGPDGWMKPYPSAAR